MAVNPGYFFAGLLTAGGGILIPYSPSNYLGSKLFPKIRDVYLRQDSFEIQHNFSQANKKKKKLASGTIISNVPPIELKLGADRQSYDLRRKRFIAEGRANLRINGASLKADRIEFDQNFQTIYARGSVRFKKGNQYFQASFFRYNLIQKSGYLEDVYGIIDIRTFEKDRLFSNLRNSDSLHLGRLNRPNKNKRNTVDSLQLINLIDRNNSLEISKEESLDRYWSNSTSPQNLFLHTSRNSLLMSPRERIQNPKNKMLELGFFIK